MYLHLGQDVVIRQQELVGIFDLDNTTVSKRTRQFLRVAEKKHQVETVSYDLPKSFIVCAKRNEKKQKIYISQLAPVTLSKRSEQTYSLQEE